MEAFDIPSLAVDVTLAAATGIAGLSIEDPTGDRAHPLMRSTGGRTRCGCATHHRRKRNGIALTGCSEGLVCGRPDIDETIRRLCAYADAGADCLYAPRIDTAEQVAAIVAAVSSKPVNVLIDALSVTVAEAAALGVRRISVEGTLARTAWAGFLQAAQEIADSGSFSRFEILPNVDAPFPQR